MRTTTMVLLLALAASGCVFKGKRELLEVQLDATRIAMSARAEQCQTDIRTLERKLDDVTLEIVLRQLQLDELSVRTDLRDTELERLQAERVALATDLEAAVLENESLRKELEAEKAKNRRRRRRPIESPAPGGTEPGEPATEGLRALADIQATLEQDFQDRMQSAFIDRMHEATVAAFQPLLDGGHVEVVREGKATVVRIPTSKLFQEGWATLSPRGMKIVADARAALAQIPGRDVSVEAHTDNVPVHSARFPSNWEKGFGRAVAVLHALEAGAFVGRLSATSFAGTRPLVKGDTPQARQINRRVELVITVDPEIAQRYEPSEGVEATEPEGPDGDGSEGAVAPEPEAEPEAEPDPNAPSPTPTH